MDSSSVDVRFDGSVAVVTLSHPPANALTPRLLENLCRALEVVHRREDVRGIVLAGANGRFSSGFDIREFARGLGASGAAAGLMDRMHAALCTLLEVGPKPTVAALERLALGGGLEIAMACNARVCTPGASLGLPELRLGIIPGAGGTQRLPRLVGLRRGLDMMLQSQIVEAEDALRLGLVDAVVPQPELLQAAKQLALDMADGRRPRCVALERGDKLGKSDEAGAVLAEAAEQAAGRGRHAELCVEAVRFGVEKGGKAGLNKELQCFVAAAARDQHKALVHMYFGYRATKKLRGLGALQAATAALRHFLLAWFYQTRGTLKRLLGRV